MVLNREFTPVASKSSSSLGDRRNLLEIVDDVEQLGFEQRHADRHATAAEEQRVAVGGPRERRIRRDRAAAARVVLEDQVLAELGSSFVWYKRKATSPTPPGP